MKTINIDKARVEMMQFLEIADKPPALKLLQVRIHHSTHPPFKLQIRPGTKCSDVLSYLQLTEDYILSPLSDPTKTFTPNEVLYDLIENDAKLIAKLSPDAERRYANLFMQ